MNELSQVISKIFAYLPLIPIVLSLVFNPICFFIFSFCRKFNRIPSMVFLSFIAVFDTLSQFCWNLNHFLKPVYGFKIEALSLFSCRFFSFIQYFSLQSSANLLSLLCVDRYFSIIATPGSLASRLPFGTPKSALIWSICISTLIFLLNFHLLIFNGYYLDPIKRNGTNNSNPIDNKLNHCYSYSSSFTLTPVWDQVHLIVYNMLPYTLMVTFNILLIAKSLLVRKSVVNKNVQNKKRKLTISILAITFAFITMTLPASMVYGFFYKKLTSLEYGRNVLEFFDFIMFLYHSSLFFICFVSNVKFRKFIILKFFKRKQKSTENTQFTAIFKTIN